MLGRLALIAFVAAGCAHGAVAPPATGPRPRTLEMGGALVTADEALDDEGLFARAGEDLAGKRFADAARRYDTLVGSFPTSGLILPALYNAGLAYEGLGDWQRAALRYAALEERYPKTTDAVDAAFRRGGCEAELKRWAAMKATFAALAGRADLSLSDRVEALTLRGTAELWLRDLDTAERTFRQSLELFRAHETEERLDTDYYVAMAQFQLGAVARERYSALPIRLPEKRMAEDVERKAALLLDAQARFLRAIRLGNAHWAAAAGYEIGALYRSFYDALIGAPLPGEVAGSAEMKGVYFEELKKKIRPLLEKALRTHEQMLLMAERAGVENDWVRRASLELEELRRLLAPLGQPVHRDELPPPPLPAAPAPGRLGDTPHRRG